MHNTASLAVSEPGHLSSRPGRVIILSLRRRKSTGPFSPGAFSRTHKRKYRTARDVQGCTSVAGGMDAGSDKREPASN